MISFPFICATIFVAASVNGAPLPLTKRIAQVISDSTTKWEAACNAAGGAAQCSTVAVASFGTLLAAPGPCEQQDAADSMVDLAKTLKSDADMITFAQIFAQQPRNSPNSLSVPYCQQAPKNTELNGLFQCQYQGSSATSFVGGLTPGQTGTVPFGMSAALSPAGSCAANPSGPIADGTQLTDLTSNSGVPAGGNSASSGAASPSASAVASANSGNSTGSSSGSGDSDGEPTATASATSAAATGSANTGSFQLQNGQDAQKLNAQFATLTATSSCNTGDQACVSGGFAQCVGGAFVVTQCAASTQCAALPLVNKAGTSITCTTQADAEARIQATGATGGLTGSGSASAPSSAASGAVALAAPSTAAAASTSATAIPDTTSIATSAAATTSAAASGSASGGSFQLQNGQDAQKLNAQFATLTATSSCTAGEQACVNGGFAQCVGGTFAVTQCAASTQCAALPLVNKAGTSITCTTQADAEARIQATGATGGLTGSG